MNFIAIDVETANAQMRSICRIGLVKYENDVEVGFRDYLINPGEYFDPYNTLIHGITQEQVKASPSFPDVLDELSAYTDGHILVAHTHFDRTSLSRACLHHSTDDLSRRWLDTAKVARRAWPECASYGYGLAKLAKNFGIPLSHHDAVSDARASGSILLKAMAETGLDLNEWLVRCNQPVHGVSSSGREVRQGTGDGVLAGEVMVFTGSLALSRKDAADMADAAGASVDAGVTARTTLLVVGDQDAYKLAGSDKSSKHRKAENLITKGQSIRILTEADFISLVAS